MEDVKSGWGLAQVMDRGTCRVHISFVNLYLAETLCPVLGIQRQVTVCVCGGGGGGRAGTERQTPFQCGIILQTKVHKMATSHGKGCGGPVWWLGKHSQPPR